MTMPGRTAAILDALRREPAALLPYLRCQRWFGAKSKTIVGLSLHDSATLSTGPSPTILPIFAVRYADESEDLYFVPLVEADDTEGDRTAGVSLSVNGEPIRLVDATADERAALALLDGIKNECVWKGAKGTITCGTTDEGRAILADPPREVRRMTGEQSNTSLRYDDRIILKLVRRLQPGLNPDREILDFLTDRTSYRHVPILVGWIEYEGPTRDSSGLLDGTLAMGETFIPNDGDAWRLAVDNARSLLRAVAEPGSRDSHAESVVAAASQDFFQAMRQLGAITADLHAALASDGAAPAFLPERITDTDLVEWHRSVETRLSTLIAALPSRRNLPMPIEEIKEACRTELHRLTDTASEYGAKIRIHGDYHLGQVIKSGTDFTILDFEGEPARPLPERRAKLPAVKDIAGMLRSFHYAGHVAVRERGEASATATRAIESWVGYAEAAFLSGYRERARPGHVIFLPRTERRFDDLLHLFLLDKVLYEVEYELNNRPDWLGIPLEGLRRILTGSGEGRSGR